MKQIKTGPARDQIRVPQNGRVLYTMKNDYMFRAVLQTNRSVLKSLICSLLHLEPETDSACHERGQKISNRLLGGAFQSDDMGGNQNACRKK